MNLYRRNAHCELGDHDQALRHPLIWLPFRTCQLQARVLPLSSTSFLFFSCLLIFLVDSFSLSYGLCFCFVFWLFSLVFVLRCVLFWSSFFVVFFFMYIQFFYISFSSYFFLPFVIHSFLCAVLLSISYTRLLTFFLFPLSHLLSHLLSLSLHHHRLPSLYISSSSPFILLVRK